MDRKQMFELLCDCLSGRDRDALSAKLAPLAPSDWERLVQTAGPYNVAPFLKYRLEPLVPRLDIPDEVLFRLRKMFLESVSCNMHLYMGLADILKSMKRDRIPVIALKGACLAQEVYDSIGLRSMCDVDILVPKPDLQRAADSLRRIGYSTPGEFDLEVETARSLHLPQFNKPGAPAVDVHWTIEQPMHPFRIDIDGVWKRARPAAIAGVDILTPSPEDLLLHACLHASYHHRFDASALKAFCDISEILRRHGAQMDWEQFTLRADQWKISRSVHLCLYLAREMMGAPAPPTLLEAMQPADFNRKIVAEVREKIGSWKKDQQLPENFNRLWGISGFRNRAAYFMKIMFPSPEVLSRKHPAPPDSWRIYFYYPTRWKELFTRNARSAWRILCKDDETMNRVEKENYLKDYLTPD